MNEQEPAQYDPVTCTGLQPNSEVFVSGPNFQIHEDGSLVLPGRQNFIWIDSILHNLQQPVNPLPPIPDYSLEHLSTLIRGMHSLAGDNILSGMYLTMFGMTE